MVAELYSQPLQGTGAGQTTLITRKHFLMHPRGVKFVPDGTAVLDGLYPTDAELATATKWSQVYSDKNIKMVKLVTNA
jgi:hypothetical protein